MLKANNNKIIVRISGSSEDEYEQSGIGTVFDSSLGRVLIYDKKGDQYQHNTEIFPPGTVVYFPIYEGIVINHDGEKFVVLDPDAILAFITSDDPTEL